MIACTPKHAGRIAAFMPRPPESSYTRFVGKPFGNKHEYPDICQLVCDQNANGQSFQSVSRFVHQGMLLYSLGYLCLQIRYPLPDDGLCQPWPAMQCLKMTGVAITTSALKCIVGCSMPHLRRLHFDSIQVNPTNMEELGKGKWPHLCCLVIRNVSNASNASGQQILLQGDWPLLGMLWIEDRII